MFIVLAVMFLFTAVCCKNKEKPKHKMVREEIIEYESTDSPFVYYGYYREVFRYYNYEYKDSHLVTPYYKFPRMIDAFVNEYGDTTRIIYIDLTNYPRREE